MHPAIEAVLADQGVIRASAYPRLGSTLTRLKQAGVLDAPLPGVYVRAGEDSALVRLRAVCAWAGPSGVLHDRSAASIWLPELSGPVAFLAHPTLRSRPRVVVCRRQVPPEFVAERQGLRFASPSYSAVELAALDDGRTICEALRRGLADGDSLAAADAALRGSHGQVERSRVVAACTENPWSYAELRLQRILRQAGIADWVANRPLVLGGHQLRPDIRMRRRRLVIEFDGRAVHGADQFLADRERQNLLESAGYHVLRFGWEHLDQPEYVVTAVRDTLRHASPA